MRARPTSTRYGCHRDERAAPLAPLQVTIAGRRRRRQRAVWTAAQRAIDRAVAFDRDQRELGEHLHGQAMTILAKDGTRLHAEAFGPDDAPAVVLIHGWMCNIRFWTRQIKPLAAELRVVAYDLRGHGRSAQPHSRDYSIDAHASDLAAVLEHALPGKRVVLAGHSLGAMTIAAWADRQPQQMREQLAGAVLINTALDPLLEHDGALQARRMAAIRVAVSRAAMMAQMPISQRATPLSHLVVRHVALDRWASPAEVAFCAQMISECRTDVRAACGAMLYARDPRTAVAAIVAPTVVIAGGRDRLTPPGQSRRIAHALPRLSDDIVLDDAGHMAPVTHPGMVNGLISNLTRQALG